MSLVLDYSSCLAENCRSVDITETTGVYSALNTGGYGAPNLLTTDVLTATIAVTALGESTPLATVNVYPTLPSSAEGEVTIDNTDLGFTSTEVIPDTVYQLLYTITGTLAVTGASVGSSTFTVAGDRSGVFIVGDTFTITGGATNAGTYTVTAISYSSSTTINVTPAPASATITENVINFTEYTSQYVLFSCTAEACISNKLSELNVTDCEDCYSNKLNLISKMDTFLEAARKAAACSKPNKAGVLISYVTSLCNLTSCSDC